MQLRGNGFWAVLYRDCRRLWINFIRYRGDPRLEATDLCTFVRTIFVLAPMALALNIAALGFAAYAVALLLFILSFHLSIVGIIILILIAGCILAGALIGAIYVGHLVIHATRDSETAKLTGEYLAAKKSAICPLISFREVV